MPGVPGDFMVDDQELRELVFKDELTGLYNRRFFARFMKQEADWSPGAPPLAMAMIDMDNLKRINDRLGHLAGDATLKRLGSIFTERCGEKNFAIRYAGDEFAVLMPGATRKAALGLAETLRQAVVSDGFEEAQLPDGLHPSLSVGVAVFPDDAPGGGDDLTEAADRALYVSKRTGKNKVTDAAELQGGGEVVADLEALSGFPSRTLVGREAAFRAISDAVSLALEGKNGLLIVEGAPGSGKTRLLAELARYGKERGLGVLIERCSAVTREEPYKPIAALLEAWLRAHPDRAVQAAGGLSGVQRACLKDLVPALAQVGRGRGPGEGGPGGGGPGGPAARGPGPGTRTPPRQPRPRAPGTAIGPAPPGAPRRPGQPPGPGRPPAGPRPAGPPGPGAQRPSPSGAHSRPRLRPKDGAPPPRPRPGGPVGPGGAATTGAPAGGPRGNGPTPGPPAPGGSGAGTGGSGPSGRPPTHGPTRFPQRLEATGPRPPSERLPVGGERTAHAPPVERAPEEPRSGRPPAVAPDARGTERPAPPERPGTGIQDRNAVLAERAAPLERVERPGSSIGERPDRSLSASGERSLSASGERSPSAGERSPSTGERSPSASGERSLSASGERPAPGERTERPGSTIAERPDRAAPAPAGERAERPGSTIAERPDRSVPAAERAERPGSTIAERPDRSVPAAEREPHGPGIDRAGERSGTGPHDRQRALEATGERPGTGSGERPGLAGERPGTTSGERPGTTSGERPGTGSGERPGTGSGERPGLAAGERVAVPPSTARYPKPSDPAEVTAAVFTGLLELMAGVARVKPLVLVLDDVEFADEATVELLRRALPRTDRILFVGGARVTDQAAFADEAPAPWAMFRAQLNEHANAIVLELPPLGREHTAELASQLLAGFRPPAAFLDRLFSITGGNPLFVEGALRHLVETRALTRTDDGWRAQRELPAQLPLSLEELIRNRLKILDPALAELVGQAAVVGPNFDFEVLRASTGKREGEALELASGAVKAKLLEEPPQGGRFEFASRTVEDTTYRALEPEARQEAHRRVGEALEAQDGAAAPPAAALAFHFGRAGDRQKRDRFAAQMRERRDLVFDREAIENLGDGRHPRIREATEVAPPTLIACMPALAKALANASKVVKQYPASSKVVTDAVNHLATTIANALEQRPAFTISHRGNALTLNGRPVDKGYGEGPSQEAVSGLFRVNSIKSLTFLKPPDARELLAFLIESASRSVQVPIERYFWSVFAADHDLRALGIVQKTLTLHSQHGLEQQPRPEVPRVGEQHRPLVEILIGLMGMALQDARKAGPDVDPPAAPDLDRTLRQLFQHAPALALHEGDGEALVVNGTPIELQGLPLANEVLKALRETRLRGFVLLEAVAPQELARFMALLAAPASREPTAELAAAINSDGSFPNVLAGDALLQLARDLLSPREGAVAGPDDAGAPAEAPARAHEELSRPPHEEDADMPPVTFRDADLPAQFEWPTDAAAQRAYALTKVPAQELLAAPASTELADVLEMILLEGRLNLSFRLVDRLAVNFASQDPADRRRAADVFLGLSRKASHELRANFFAVAVRRLGDAIELESDPDVFDKLADCARVGILERVAEGDWDVAARLVWALGRRRDKRNDAQTRLEKTGKRVLAEVLEDPRFERVFETIESGSQQERRKAARILEGMGPVAVERLVRALRETTRGGARVETFLIDMLAALVPDSETALQKEVTPFSTPADATGRLLRAAAVVCRDATAVLINGLQNADPVIQAEAVTVARSLGGKVAQNVLRWAIQHGAPQAQLAAVQHLGELARPDAVDELLDLLNRTNIVEVQRECCLAFGKLSLARAHHEKVVPVLASCLRPGSLLRKEYHEDVRAAAAFALGQMKSIEAARKALENALEDKVPRVRRTAQLMLEGK